MFYKEQKKKKKFIVDYDIGFGGSREPFSFYNIFLSIININKIEHR